MKISKELINELEVILREDYNMKLYPPGTESWGNSIIKYFDILLKTESEAKVRK